MGIIYTKVFFFFHQCIYGKKFQNYQLLMKKILKLLIGTNNIGKYKEIRDLLPKYIKTYSTSNFKLKSPKENGLTFIENSIIKSRYFSKKTNLICLADDSGLEIDLLDNAPGIYSARWGGKKRKF